MSTHADRLACRDEDSLDIEPDRCAQASRIVDIVRRLGVEPGPVPLHERFILVWALAEMYAARPGAPE
jgi:hypothetical protein